MIDQIAPSDFARWLADMALQHPLERTVLLDVREPYELEWASVGQDAATHGYQLLTIPMAVVPVRLAELDPDQPIACLCHHGSRSMQVAAYLSSQGFTHLANIEGGIHAWSSQVDPNVPTY